MAETRRGRPGELHRRRVVLVTEGAGLTAVLNHLLDPVDRLSCLGSLRELAESRSLDSADVVVLDVPTGERVAAVGEVRRRHLGPLVILVTKGEPIGGLRLDDACTLLYRPFSADELGAILAAPRRAPGAGKPGVEVPPAGPDGPPAGPTVAGPEASARQAPVRPAPTAPPGRPGLVERGQRLLIALTQGWQARRRVRVAGFSAFALVAFTAAFTLAAQGGRCGPGCDAFGTLFSPGPTVPPASSRAPSTTGPKRSTATTAARSGYPGTGAFRGVSGGQVATTTTERQKPATTEPATTRPATTRPPVTTRPPTTAPPTTAPPTTAPPTTAPPTAPPTTAGA